MTDKLARYAGYVIGILFGIRGALIVGISLIIIGLIMHFIELKLKKEE